MGFLYLGVFFSFSVSLVWLHAYIIYSLIRYCCFTGLFTCSFLHHLPHPSSLIHHSSYPSPLVSLLPLTSPGLSFVQPSITSIRSLPLFGLLFPHIIDTYHIVTIAMNSVCIFSSSFLFRCSSENEDPSLFPLRLLNMVLFQKDGHSFPREGEGSSDVSSGEMFGTTSEVISRKGLPDCVSPR